MFKLKLNQSLEKYRNVREPWKCEAQNQIVWTGPNILYKALCLIFSAAKRQTTEQEVEPCFILTEEVCNSSDLKHQ